MWLVALGGFVALSGFKSERFSALVANFYAIDFGGRGKMARL